MNALLFQAWKATQVSIKPEQKHSAMVLGVDAAAAFSVYINFYIDSAAEANLKLYCCFRAVVAAACTVTGIRHTSDEVDFRPCCP